MIRFNDLLQTPSLSELNVIAGKSGLSRQINTVTVLDAPDGPKWLKGGEFVLTSAYIFENHSILLENYIWDLIQIKACGLGIKTGRFMDIIPEHISKLADTNHFPIIQIPYKFVWTDIISPFYKLKYELEVHKNPIIVEPDMIIPIIEASKQGSDKLLKQMTEYFKIPMAIYQSDKSQSGHNQIYGTHLIDAAISKLKILPEQGYFEEIIINDMIFSFSCFSITFDGTLEYLAFASEQADDIRELNKLLTLLNTLKGSTRLVKKEKSEIYRNFIYKIVANKITAEEIFDFAQKYGEEQDSYNYSCFILLSSIDCILLYHCLKKAAEIYKNRNNSQIDFYLFLNPTDQQAFVILEHNTKQELETTSWLRGFLLLLDLSTLEDRSASISISSMTKTLNDMQTAYEECLSVQRIGTLLWPGQSCYFYPDISPYILFEKMDFSLVTFDDIRLLEQSANTISFDGIETSETYLESGNYKRASAKLFIHENTLRYRIHKISELINLNLEDPIESQRFLTKIKLWKIYNSNKKHT